MQQPEPTISMAIELVDEMIQDGNRSVVIFEEKPVINPTREPMILGSEVQDHFLSLSGGASNGLNAQHGKDNWRSDTAQKVFAATKLELLGLIDCMSSSNDLTSRWYSISLYGEQCAKVTCAEMSWFLV